MSRFENELTLVDARAATGAKWFDKNYPGWHQAIDRAQLDISDDCHCVVGQIAGSFNDCAKDFFRKLKDRVEHGVLIPQITMNVDQYDQYYDAITEAWNREIEQRMAA